MRAVFLIIILFSMNAKAYISESQTEGMIAVIKSKAIRDFSNSYEGVFAFQGIKILPKFTMDPNRYYSVSYTLWYTSCYVEVMVSGLEGPGSINLLDSNCSDRVEVEIKIGPEIRKQCKLIIPDIDTGNTNKDLEALKIIFDDYTKCQEKVIAELIRQSELIQQYH